MEQLSDPIDRFFEFCYDRHLVWFRRYVLGRPAPWTDNKVMQTYKFTNIYRELDAVSKHLMENICNNTNLSDENKFFNLLIGRVFNTRYTFDVLFPILDASNFDRLYYEAVLDNKLKKDVQIWNPAYTVTQMKYDGSYRKEKHAQFLLLFEHVAKNIVTITKNVKQSSSMKDAVRRISELKLVGDFLAAEIAQDLCYCKTFFLNGMDDNHDLAVVGPGTLQSISEVYGVPLGTSKQLERYVLETWEKQPIYWQKLLEWTGKDWTQIAYQESCTPPPYLSVNNIESAFCEYRKYINISNGVGRKKYYKPSN